MKSNKKKGFSLIEVLAAVTILGILSLIAVVSINNIVQKAKDAHYETAEKNLTSAGESYAQNNRDSLPKAIGQKTTVSLQELIDKNYIKPIKDYNDNACDATKSYVQIFKYSQNDYSYLAYLECPNYKSDINSKSVIPSITINLEETEDRNSKATIKITDNNKLMSYSYIVYRENVEIYNSGSVALPRFDTEVDKEIDLNEYTPGKIKVVVSAINIYGNSTTLTKTKTFEDKQGPSCIISDEDKNPKDWITSGKRTITVKCDDGKNGSGCKQESYTKVFETTAKTGVVTISDKEGNKTDCSVSVYIDKDAPTCTVSGGNSDWINASSSKTTRIITATCKDQNNGSGCKYTSFSHEYSGNINTKKAGANGINQGGYVEDNAGNKTNCAANQTVKIDKESPICTVSGGNSDWINAKSSTTSRTITATCSDTGGSKCKTAKFETEYKDNIETTQAGAKGNKQGGYVEDYAGNKTNCVADQTVKIDKTIPDKPTMTYTLNSFSGSKYKTGNWTNKTVYRQIKSSDEESGISHFEYQNATSSTGSCSGPGTGRETLLNASNKISNNINYKISYQITSPNYACFRTVDKAGNVSSWTAVQKILVDQNEPNVPTLKYTLESYTGSTYTAGDWANKTIYRQIKAKDDESGISHFEYKKATSTTGTCSGDATGEETLKNATNGISDNKYYKISYPISATNYACFRTVDKAGNVSDWTPNQKLLVDKEKPSAPTVALVNGGWTEVSNDTWYNFDIYVSGRADSSNPTPRSTDTGGSKIKKYQISTNKTKWYDWSYSWADSLYYITTAGTTYRYVRAIDNAGNISDITTKTIKIDRSAPTLTVKLNNGSYTSGTWTKNDVTRYIQGSDDGEIARYEYVTGANCTGTPQKESSSWIGNSNWKTSSSNYACHRVVDKAGNYSDWVESDIRIDKTAPDPPNIYLSSTSETASNVTFTLVRGADNSGGSGGTYAQYSYNGTTWINYPGSAVTLLTDTGKKTVYARTVDRVGNVSSTVSSTGKCDKDAVNVEWADYNSCKFTLKLSLKYSPTGVTSNKYQYAYWNISKTSDTTNNQEDSVSSYCGNTPPATATISTVTNGKVTLKMKYSKQYYCFAVRPYRSTEISGLNRWTVQRKHAIETSNSCG